MKEISIKDIENISIGQVEDTKGGTGLTVLISKEGMPTGINVGGGGPASREIELVKAHTAAGAIHAIVIGGGSAFGLDAAGGVQQYLEEHDIGYDVDVTKVPLVCQSDIFDLTVGDSHTRPDKKMGYAAAKIALENSNYQDGCYGAGVGATVGKICGMSRCMKSGIGSYAIEVGELKIGAIVVVNALGDIYNYHNGQKIAGLLSEDKQSFSSTEEEMLKASHQIDNKFLLTNTTIGVILTNAKFGKTDLCTIAKMAQDGYARSIRPVHTSADGDTVYASSLGNVKADIDLVGSLAADVMSEAIMNALKHAKSGYGYPSMKEFNLHK